MTDFTQAPLRQYEMWSMFYRQYFSWGCSYSLKELADHNVWSRKVKLDYRTVLSITDVWNDMPVFTMAYNQGSITVRSDGSFYLYDSYPDVVTVNVLTKHTWFTDGYAMRSRVLTMDTRSYAPDNMSWDKRDDRYRYAWLNVRDSHERRFYIGARLLHELSSNYWMKLVPASRGGNFFSDVDLEFEPKNELQDPWQGKEDGLPRQWAFHLADIKARRERYAKAEIRKAQSEGQGAYYSSLVNTQAVAELAPSIIVSG